MKATVVPFILVFISSLSPCTTCTGSGGGGGGRLSWALSPKSDPNLQRTIFASHAQTRVDRALFLTTFFPKIINTHMFKYGFKPPTLGVSYQIEVTFAQLMESMIILLPTEQYKKFISIPIREVVLEARVDPDASLIFPSSQDMELYVPFTMDVIDYISIIGLTPIHAHHIKYLRENYSQDIDTLHYPAEYDVPKQRLMLHAHHNIFMEFLHFIASFQVSPQAVNNHPHHHHHDPGTPSKVPSKILDHCSKSKSKGMEWEWDETQALYDEARNHAPKQSKYLGEGSSEESVEDAVDGDWKLLSGD